MHSWDMNAGVEQVWGLGARNFLVHHSLFLVRYSISPQIQFMVQVTK